MIEHHGFRVRGLPPGKLNAGSITMDRFDLRGVAIECARLLEAKGWTKVECHEITREVYPDCAFPEEFTRVDFR